ncbi:MAG: hypothetical protein CVT60_02635 [Actinobacteria bacterium HGW-Actinobacteria-10]|nr:MAG: hypothetical protein CVT60_02635 [Actinobacteria bacterium HGW-Actinobacteria-10]
MFGISGTELFFIAVFAMLIFGPEEMPKMARTVGRFIKEFKRAQSSMEAMIRAEILAEERKSADQAEAAKLDQAAEAVQSEAANDDDDDEDEEDEESL